MASLGRPGSPGSDRSDVALIALIKKGDLQAFSELVERHQRSLVNFFFHLSWDRHVAEDCAQEVFLKLYARMAQYEPQAKFTTFLFRVAKNLWIDKLRAGAGNPKPVSLESPTSSGGERPLRDRVAARIQTPLEILEEEEQEDALRRAIDALPEEQRLVVVLSERLELRYREIGEILEIPVGTVKSRMHAAVEKLKEMLNG
jgi:RNA polymerase sigma-70 factor (ECF subfamily)